MASRLTTAAGRRVRVPAAVAASMALAATVASTALGAPAAATPGDGVEAVTLSQSTLNGKDYVTKEITIAPGGSTGWHYHPGELFGVVRHGTLTHYASDCTVDGVYGPGSPVVEGSGPGYVHEGRNEGGTPVVLWVLYIDPAGSPLSVDMPNPGCPFS